MDNNLHPYHRLLALSGEGSAHPGGFAATLRLLDLLPIDSTWRVMDAGCGSGRTACYISNTFNCHVVGLDIQPLMIEKAIQRATSCGARVDWLCCDILELPQDSGFFDLILTESVLLFTSSLSPIYNHIKPGGLLASIELASTSTSYAPELQRIYGIDRIPTVNQWLNYYTEANFKDVQCLWNKPINIHEAAVENTKFPDFYQQVSDDFMNSEQTQELMVNNAIFFSKNTHLLHSVAILGKKMD